jgi:micrococcal nuclease
LSRCAGVKAVIRGTVLLGTMALIAAAARSANPSGCPGRQQTADTGVITRVADGDTLRVRLADGGERRVRLIGINSPELNDERQEPAFWAFLAARYTLFHLRGRSVRLEYDETRLDDYGRTLAYVLTEDGALFNERIIRDGYARAFLKYPFREDYRARFRQAQADAKRSGRGLWHSGDPKTITASAAGANLGGVFSVRFDCASVTRERGFMFLRSAAKDFEALVPLDRLSAFARLEDCAGRSVAVTGFIEAFRGRPQILLHFPHQLRLE